MRSYFTPWLDEPVWPEFRQSYLALRLDNALVQRGWSDELVHDFDQIWQVRGFGVVIDSRASLIYLCPLLLILYQRT